MSLSTFQTFFVGGFSGCIATTAIQPIDMIKTSIQIRNEMGKSTNIINVARSIYEQGGIRRFYKGYDSAIIRQVFYGTARLGGYRYLYNQIKTKKEKVTIIEKSMCSLIAGIFGSLIGNPADLILIRMQNDLNLPLNERRNYKNFFDALRKIIKQESIKYLWNGSIATICRTSAMNIGMMVTFDEVKEKINDKTQTKDLLSTRLISSSIAGFSAAFMALPFDNAKTKLQKMKLQQDGTFPHRNIYQCMKNTIRYEGISGLWVGFPVFYMRVAPHAMITLVSMEILTDLLKL